MKQEDYIGKTYNKLTILNFETPEDYKNKKTGYIQKQHVVTCKCNCGNLWTGKLQNIKRETTTSCGCYKTKTLKENPRGKTHGLVNTSEYYSWNAMKNRCLNKNAPNYHNYGGRGITVCDRWKDSFENFYTDMGSKPKKGYSIDRIDNNGNYEPNNCKWSSQKEQTNNQRTNKLLTYKNKIQTLSQWCEELNLNRDTVIERLNKYKWTIEKVLETKTNPKKLKLKGL